MLAAQFLPHIGAKLCSLRVKRAGLELLVQRPDPVCRLAPYDGDYVAQGECSGCDEMFPSIDRCFYGGYLAVLPNEGGWQDLYNIFLEPATASFDRLDAARLRGECSTVKAGGKYDWHLAMQVA